MLILKRWMINKYILRKVGKYFLREECLLINVKDMVVLGGDQKSSLYNHHHNYCFRQKSSVIVKSGEER